MGVGLLTIPAPAATVLYVEDDADDVFFFRRALLAQNVECNLQRVSNVAAAKSYLAGNVPYNDRARFPLPALLVTDLTMAGPGESSIDLVSWIRSNPEMAHLAVVCATGNDQPRMLEDFARLGITCHRKTSHMAEIADAVKLALSSARTD